ncbi:SDR family oxidoreductase [Chitinophaga sp. XS-30]|uniref:SDR family oxidoreductase n=1 Tax=Chitinophaga sp. XS-30 TaxID=2604421 RepID=UPI0011DD748F|nr:SDR family oxidoreductase [Chitinophaga sp. XS-30]QEH43288.1 SDR family oxidoreductase [Chitinophaga sp. XS-30]
MKLVIIGGTGLIGSQVTKKLSDRYEVLAASPQTGVNTLTKEGLDEALKDASVVMDVSNSPSFADDDVMNFFKTSTENLVAASKKAGIKHLIILSVAGTSRLQASGYFRAKQVQEDLVKASGIPYTIVQATQFFEFAGGIAYMGTVDGKAVLPDAFSQPVASAEVASFMAEKATGEPANATLEIGGPERIAIDAWIRQYLKMMNSPLEVVTDANALYSGAAIGQTTLTPDNPVFLGSIKYNEWISKPENQR